MLTNITRADHALRKAYDKYSAARRAAQNTCAHRKLMWNIHKGYVCWNCGLTDVYDECGDLLGLFDGRTGNAKSCGEVLFHELTRKVYKVLV